MTFNNDNVSYHLVASKTAYNLTLISATLKSANRRAKTPLGKESSLPLLRHSFQAALIQTYPHPFFEVQNVSSRHDRKYKRRKPALQTCRAIQLKTLTSEIGIVPRITKIREKFKFHLRVKVDSLFFSRALFQVALSGQLFLCEKLDQPRDTLTKHICLTPRVLGPEILLCPNPNRQFRFAVFCDFGNLLEKDAVRKHQPVLV